ncbi:neuronal PAS domain-containing protein 2-like isoform X2 [Plodia interpunctella]|uniref:neuronal PAS domain-containing protein 2-like isoform X2 n=1 Tax=Plodia interpunctella TaxID=58824 RepID=UPI002367B910|nr:neuronal PAS domain-containing protein 2-like isoform X2 [Plodia interpunctella]
MAEATSRAGVIRRTRDFVPATSLAPSSPDDAESRVAPSPISTASGDDDSPTTSISRDNPREIRNKAEKQRRDKLNQSIAELAAMVPPVVAASRKIDKTGILRLTAHYLRSHQYVFGDSIGQAPRDFSPAASQALLTMLNGFLITTTYKGLVVVVSQNVQQYLGYTELELLGQNIFTVVHEDDRQIMKDALMPKSHLLGNNGELLIPDEPNGKKIVAEALASEKRSFIVRFKKLSQRSEPSQYVTCYVEGSLRKSDRACRGYNRCCQMVRRARARGDNPCSSGNDIVFVGVVRPTTETFHTESAMETFRMEYRTRHCIDGQIIQTEHRIGLVTGYMTDEVNGVNALNFMHKDDVRWVIIALREMYDQHRLFGESCYRLMTKNGQFIYMRTRGRLDVDQDSRAVTSFVCTNTVVEEQEGKHLIKLMKKKFTLLVNNNEDPPQEDEAIENTNNHTLPVEDPRQLEKVILHLVTNLPSPQSEDDPPSVSPDRRNSPSPRLSIIPPPKKRIVSAIEKIYSVLNTFSKPREVKSHSTSIEELNSLSSSPVTETSSNTTFNMSDSPLPLAFTPTMYTGTTSSNHFAKLPTFNKICKREQPNNDSGNQPYFHSVGNNTAYQLSGNSAVSAITAPMSFYKNPESNVVQNDSKYQFLNSQQKDEKNQLIDSQQTSIVTTGLKRQRDCKDGDVAFKKKNVETSQLENDTYRALGQEAPSFDTFFDEELLNTSFSQIDSAIDSLEQTIIDPSFPDLLISKEVQDILGAIDDGPNDDHVT